MSIYLIRIFWKFKLRTFIKYFFIFINSIFRDLYPNLTVIIFLSITEFAFLMRLKAEFIINFHFNFSIFIWFFIVHKILVFCFLWCHRNRAMFSIIIIFYKFLKYINKFMSIIICHIFVNFLSKSSIKTFYHHYSIWWNIFIEIWIINIILV